MPDLSEKVFVITGGNGGIGLGLAEGIAEAGGAVAIWARNETKNKHAVNFLKDLGIEANSYICDVSNEENVVRTLASTVKDFGRIDGLFANAGRAGTGSRFMDTSLEQWRQVMSVNLDGVFICLREAAKQLISQGSGGSLVAVSSTSAIHGAGGNEAYGTAKTAVTGLVRALAVSLARYEIRVNCLLPGWTVTELASPAFENDKFREVTTRRTPVRRWADPKEFREVGAFLADPSQTFHTGQQVCVDGGYTIF
ncbi:MAG: oxidoreductase [Acidimicrobiaceae bacterium]|jgi:NAD(P)-dependent dehydrogenase (short-subunit alcohol dehydrogenase family)|nr:oxidoreductase [Acidimicrobiaceae bacterium]|tara:strand:+ start:53638 stop:54396 length:759 start_codon:yes stop_codon:yes gene_type:complete